MPKSENTSPEIQLLDLLEEADRRRARTDCVFFIEHYLKTFDPRPEAYPHHLDFTLYEFQKDYVNGLVDAINEGYDIFDEKSRDMGASWLALAVRFHCWLFKEGYQGLLGSRKEEYVDDGTLKSLFPKIDYFIEHIRDPLILPEGFDRNRHRTYMKLINPSNGNTITGESSNKNFSRGGRFTDILYDEVGFWPDARNSWTAGGDATHCRHAVTTPPNEPSFAKELRFSGKVKIRTFHWRLHPFKDDAWYEYEVSRRSEEEVLHELDISWEYSSTGRPYPEIKNVPFGNHGFLADMPLYVSIDLGLDAVALGYYQPVKNSPWINMIEAFEASDHVIEWYFPYLGLENCVNVPECPYCGEQHYFEYTDAQLEAQAIVQKFNLGNADFYGDPSGNQRHVESGISAYAILEKHGVEVQTNEKLNDWQSRRDATKRILQRLMVNDTPRTRWWANCMKDAHYPKRAENSQSVTAITKPVHDWTSHHRTQTEYFAVNYATDDSDVDSGFKSPRAPDTPTEQVYYQSNGKGFITGTGIDIGSLIKNSNNNNRDWRNT